MRGKDTQQAQFAGFVGIDWADTKHDVVIVNAETGAKRHLEVRHLAENLTGLATSLREEFDGKPVAVCLEQGRGSLLHSLMHYEHLVMFPVNPKQLKKFRDAMYPSGAKDDPKDADLLAELVIKHSSLLKVWKPDDEKTRKLGFLVEHRRNFVEDRAALANCLTASLKEFYPQAIRWVGKDIFSKQACRFLQKWPTLEDLKRARPQTIRDFFYGHRSRRADVIEKRIVEIGEAKPLTKDPAIIEAYSLRAQAIVAQILVLNESIRKYKEEIREVFDSHPDAFIFKSLPMTGSNMAPRLLTAFGTRRDRYDSAQEIQSYKGIAPVTIRSGERKKNEDRTVRWRMGCPKFDRQTFHEWAALTTRKSVWAKAYYDQQRAAGKGHHATVRALAFKWIRIIFRCWKDGVPYDEDRYLEVLRKKNSKLVPPLPKAA